MTTPAGPRERLPWPDVVKGIGLVMVVTVHVVERVMGYAEIANPSADWPPLADRVAQLAPLTGLGLWDLPLNAVRYLGWFGDHGVQLFIIMAGFGLMWGELSARAAGRPWTVTEFYRRRAWRIYPMWVAAHLLLLAFALTTGLVGIPTKAFVLSLVGIRFTPGTFYALAQSWWFIGLLLQLYLAYPLLSRAMRKLGPLRFLVLAAGLCFVVRLIGLVLLEGHPYVDPWSRGSFFVNRLAEFAFGMVLAEAMFRDPVFEARLRSPASIAAAVVALVAGLALALTLVGMSVALFLIGAGLFVLVLAAYPAMARATPRLTAGLAWLGALSLPLFLTHKSFTDILLAHEAMLPYDRALAALPHVLLGLAIALVLTWLAARLLIWTSTELPRRLSAARERLGYPGLAVRFGIAGVLAALLLGGADRLVAAVDPQEVQGWGERPSLEPSEEFGWRLKPGVVTRLRWESYDYRVTAGANGFPAPAYPAARAPGGLRILTVGDAFTSAEGVDTDKSWPRLLERALAEAPGRQGPVEVANFGITGYGPAQDAAVIRRFAPELRPDLVVVGFFVNDILDIDQDDEAFRDSIGFGKVEPDSLPTLLRLEQLRQWMRLRLEGLIEEWVQGRPSSHGYLLGNFAALEVGAADEPRRLAAVEARLREIGEAARRSGAEVLLMVIPASVQVCGPRDLAYYPRHVDLADRARFDPEAPQRIADDLARRLGFGLYDLRADLRAMPVCPYQRRNMHFTEAGHRRVAELLAQRLNAGGLPGTGEQPGGASQ